MLFEINHYTTKQIIKNTSERFKMLPLIFFSAGRLFEFIPRQRIEKNTLNVVFYLCLVLTGWGHSLVKPCHLSGGEELSAHRWGGTSTIIAYSMKESIYNPGKCQL